jgi:hypothetical protein
MLVLFSGLYFDYMATLIMLWRQADLIAYLQLDASRRLAFVMRRGFHALLTINVILSLSLMFTLIYNIDYITNTAVALLCWNISQFLVVILFVPPIFIIYHSVVVQAVDACANEAHK